MAYNFSNNVWAVQGEKSFDGITSILNPQIRVQSILINEFNVTLNLKVIENQGVYEHSYSLSSSIPSETEINAIVNSAITEAIPEAVLQQ